MLELTSENFEESIKEGRVMVDFWAEWCGPCKMVTPVLEQLAEETPDVKFFKVNVDENPELSAKYGIRSIPTILYFKEGELNDRTVGAQPKSEFARIAAQ